jgi:predicted ATPase
MVILFLEDLQWSDPATVELVAYLAQRRERARLFIIGTYRPTDTVLHSHPLRREVHRLVGRGQCHELAVELLTETEVETYLRRQLGGSSIVATLSPVIYRRTDGNALFVTHFVNYLLEWSLLVKIGAQWTLRVETSTLEQLIPDHVQSLLVKELEGLTRETQQLLEAASVVGMTFTPSEVAAILNHSLEATEAEFDDLANHGQFIAVQELAEWPDGSITVRYRFCHTLYQQVLYQRIGLAQQVRWHRQLGAHFAALYGERVPEIASELAFHFERGRDYRRALLHRQQVGEQALQQSVYQKALGHGQAGLTLLTQLPATAEYRPLELKLRQLVSAALAMSRGFTDDELEENLQRAQQLCHELHDDASLVSVLIGLTRLHLWRANRTALEELAQQEESLAERLTDSQLLLQLHTQLSWIKLVCGKHVDVVEHYQCVRTHQESPAHQFSLYSFAGDPLIAAFGASGVSLSLTGRLEQGWSHTVQRLARAEALLQPAELIFALLYAGMVKHLRGEYDEAWRLAQKMDTLAREHEFPLMVTLGELLQGGLAVQRAAVEDGVALLTTGLAQYRATGAHLLEPYFLSSLAEGYWRQGKGEKAMQTVDEALNLTATNSDVFWEAELYRQKGELTLQQFQAPSSKLQAPHTKTRNQKRETRNSSPTSNTQAEVEAEVCFHQAIEVARQQEAKLLELRVVMSLARLWRQQGRKQAARHRLAEIYNWFTEGWDTKDLQEAKALLAELA